MPINNQPEGKAGIQVVTNYAGHTVEGEDYEYRKASYAFNQQGQEAEAELKAKPKRMKRTQPASKPKAKTRQIRQGQEGRDLAKERDALLEASKKDLKQRNIN